MKFNKKKLFIVVNVDWFFLSHRLPIALAAKEKGYDVTIISFNSGKKEEILSYGFNFIDLPFERSGSNVFHELKCVLLLVQLYKKHKPDVIHHVTLKASLLGCLACKLAGNKNVVNAISGFGYNFTSGRKTLLQRTVLLSIKLAFKSKSFFFILQNPDDKKQLENFSVANPNNIVLIKGSGVDLNSYSFSLEPDDKIIKILFPARVLYDKGIVEFISAAKSIKDSIKKDVLFIIAGDCDSENLASMPESKLKSLLEKNYIEWIGFQKNIFETMKSSHIIVLPSYREGLPKSLIDACAVGRPIITTDVPGCRECVINGENGFLVPAKNVDQLAKKIQILIEKKDLRVEMGTKGRQLAENEFSIENVIEKTLRVYEKIMER